MNRSIMISLLTLYIILTTQADAEIMTNSRENDKSGVLVTTINNLEIDEEILKINFGLQNNSEDDIWILFQSDQMPHASYNADVFMMEDNHTLMIRRRLDLRTSVLGPPFDGKYVRLGPKKNQTESIVTRLPVHPISGFERNSRQGKGLEYADRLVIELGYYQGGMPDMIFKAIEKDNVKNFSFNSLNERLIARDDEVLIPHSFRKLKGESEQILRAVVSNLHIPYVEEEDLSKISNIPDLSTCTKVEIKYNPSMLEYFFPYPSLHGLLSPDEMEYLQSEKLLVIEDRNAIKTIANEVSESYAIANGIIRYRSKVDVNCYFNVKPLMSFSIYNNEVIVIEGQRLRCFKGFQSLKMLTPQIHNLSLRMLCAANLKNQWYRFCFFSKTKAKRLGDFSIEGEKIYPSPSDWCDTMLQPYHHTEFPFGISKWDEKAYICLSAGEGKCHYAMNPNCGPNSPGDMVLLFETKAGWNQHGGPELFTFDNHDPKGGCVLLNDGTVKFIRTEEELKALRWKR